MIFEEADTDSFESTLDCCPPPLFNDSLDVNDELELADKASAYQVLFSTHTYAPPVAARASNNCSVFLLDDAARLFGYSTGMADAHMFDQNGIISRVFIRRFMSCPAGRVSFVLASRFS